MKQREEVQNMSIFNRGQAKAGASGLAHRTQALFLFLFCGVCTFAQSPWEISANNLRNAIAGPIALAMMIVAIVIGGLTFAFSEGQGKRMLAGIIFGGGMAVGAARFLSWLYT